jgi:hypothetical protein
MRIGTNGARITLAVFTGVMLMASLLPQVAFTQADQTSLDRPHHNPQIVHVQEHNINGTYVPVGLLVGGNSPVQGDYYLIPIAATRSVM